MCRFHFQFCNICTIIMINPMIFSFLTFDLNCFLSFLNLSCHFLNLAIFFSISTLFPNGIVLFYMHCVKKYVGIIEYKAIHICILFVHMFSTGLIQLLQNFIILARLQTKLFIFQTKTRHP